MRIGLVVPHVFMQQELLEHVIFSPGYLALNLANELQARGNQVTLFSPGPVKTEADNITADLSYFEAELEQRGDTYIDLLKKHPLTFITLARQVQSELIAKAYAMANYGEFEVVHIYTNEEDTALPFATFCEKPVVFTHHDPYNFLVQYRSLFPKYPHLNWISMSYAQRHGMPANTNWVGNIYHGLPADELTPSQDASRDYIAYFGRIIEPKGVHLAIAAVREYNRRHSDSPKVLKIAGKHYAGKSKNTYWEKYIEPELGKGDIEYVGFLKGSSQKQEFLGDAQALLVPSTFDEPFGMVMIEALACATPLIGLDSGAIPEVIKDGQTGFVVPKVYAGTELDQAATSSKLADALSRINTIDQADCRADFEERFTIQRMIDDHIKLYEKVLKNN